FLKKFNCLFKTLTSYRAISNFIKAKTKSSTRAGKLKDCKCDPETMPNDAQIYQNNYSNWIGPADHQQYLKPGYSG
uniref:Uncharacterized protein n=1 Tax=Romanomermis culicivorax TaxID=13658 RepID=A0A915LDV0_ROMCU